MELLMELLDKRRSFLFNSFELPLLKKQLAKKTKRAINRSENGYPLPIEKRPLMHLDLSWDVINVLVIKMSTYAVAIKRR